MKILFGSDFHGHHGAYGRFSELLSQPEFDVGILAGDLTTYAGDKDSEEKTIREILSRPDKIVLFIMGNDDGILGNDWKSSMNLININCKAVMVGVYTFIGYSFTPPFIGGIFEKSEKEQEADFKKLQSEIRDHTVFISHGPAFGIRDRTANREHAGGKALAQFARDSKIILHLFGHIHDDAGVSGRSINGAYPKNREYASIDVEKNIIEFIR